jgi:hypothetical protein
MNRQEEVENPCEQDVASMHQPSLVAFYGIPVFILPSIELFMVGAMLMQSDILFCTHPSY